jgi:poly-gamma-glutamate synthesis protein (capsule biosynthesis protein)
LDLIEFVRLVRRERHNFDHLIVLYHGAAEFHAPTPQVQRNCRFMIEEGASVVVVQHPHILGGCEEYQGGHIIYGQGALVMDEAIYRDRASFHEGFLVKLNLEKESIAGLELIPFEQSNPEPGARKLKPDQAGALLRKLAARSQAVRDQKFVEDEWLQFCREHQHGYMSSLLGHSRVLRKLNSAGHLTRLLYGRRSLLGTRNRLLCETHREALETIFERLPL